MSGRLSAVQAEAVAVALERLFAVPVPPDLWVRANEPSRLTERFAEWLAEDYDWFLLQDSILVRDAIEAAQRWLVEHPTPDPWIVDPVVALGDGNLDNFMWDGRTCRLIDWEEYGVSDLAYEVADLIEHASVRLEQRLNAADLLERLALNGLQLARIAQYRRTFAFFWLAMLLPGNGGWQRNPRGSTEDQARHVLELIGSWT